MNLCWSCQISFLYFCIHRYIYIYFIYIYLYIYIFIYKYISYMYIYIYLFVLVFNLNTSSFCFQTPVAGHQWLFSRIFTPQEPTSFCIRHDVDGVLWKPVQSDTTSKVSWKHVSTFNALGFIQASKKNHKYTICGADYEFVAIVDCASNIYIYLTNNLSSKDGSQFVIELPTEDEVLGVQASKTTLFLLTKNSMFAVKVL